VMRRAWSVSPAPADRNAGVVEIGDLVVRYRVVAAPADPNADSRRENVPAVVDKRIVHDVALHALVAGLSDPYAARAQIVNVRLHDPVLPGPIGQPDAVLTDVRDLDLVKENMAGPSGFDGGPQERRRLTV